jgi:hypothetical protein
MTMKTRGTATDKLADVIQSLQLVHKSGRLTVQRDAVDGITEVGVIAFHEGQVVDAGVGQLKGADAFKKLLVWTRCHFIFEPVPPASVAAPPASGSGRSGEDWGSLQESPNEYVPVVGVPHRSQYLQGHQPDWQRLGLSRLHRQVFLLIDGRRSTQELARLIGRHHQEVLIVLADLESVGLIGQ